MAEEGVIECLIYLLDNPMDLIQRQAAKALANLGVNNDNKPLIADAGGLIKLVDLANSKVLGVRIEAVAALANLAVNGKTFSFNQITF
jgi:HEAT repeat protein